MKLFNARNHSLHILTALTAALMLVQCYEGYPVNPFSSDEDESSDEDTRNPDDTESTSDVETTDTDTAISLSLIIDDFEDGNSIPLVGNGWFVYDDTSNNGASAVSISLDEAGYVAADGEGYDSKAGFGLSYTLDQGDWAYEPYVGWGVNMGSAASSAFDASEFDGISYVFKGSAHLVLVQIFDVTDYDDYLVSVPAAADWTSVSLPFTNFAQSGWGVSVPLNLDNIQNIGWQIKGATGDTGEFVMDNVGLLGAGTVPEPEPDLDINEPNPPEEQTIDSIAIENPLQDLALASLSKGYNLTNWLEEGMFTSYEYDETTINNLAQAGFEALRLPIDLDQYIANRDDYFAGNADFSIDPLLFEILDNFEQWTAAAGLSLTIDYHQYDESFNMEEPLYTDAIIALWTAVAEHFADNERKDIFYELLNEPEQSGGVSSVSQADWTAFAEQLIEGIRSADTTHTIIFGDVNWYGISQLTRRTPFDDDNIIYAFHFYEPFIFTHQGAGWAGLGPAREIPYPYAQDRWSEYSADFGFNSTMDGWLFSQLRSYYTTGNKTWIRNQIIKAKQWAVDNNVPVICNEFGAYDGTSLKGDRIRYYTDLIDIFEELEIPWQHWFMVMDDEGVVDPELLTAFGLE